MTVHVSLTPQLEEFVKRKVESGLYHSSSEVIREALRLLEERDRFQEMKLDTCTCLRLSAPIPEIIAVSYPL